VSAVAVDTSANRSAVARKTFRVGRS
jgi:hypothetical protein